MESSTSPQEDKSQNEPESLEKSDSDFSLRKWRSESKDTRTSILVEDSNDSSVGSAFVSSQNNANTTKEEEFKNFDEPKQILTKEKSHTLSGVQQQQAIQQINEAKSREKLRTGSILISSSQKQSSAQSSSLPSSSAMPISHSPAKNESAPIHSPIQNANRGKSVTMSSFNSSAPSGRRQLSRVLSSRAYILELVQKLKNHDSSIKINSGTFSGKDLVDWVVKETNCPREDALEMAHKMLESNDVYLAEEYDTYLGQVVSMQIDSDSVLLSFESIKHRKELMISRYGVTPQIAESIFAQKKKIKDKLEAQLANPKLPTPNSSQPEVSLSQSPPPERKIREPAPDAPGFSFSRPPPQRKPPPTPQRSNSAIISKSSSNTPIPKVPSSSSVTKSASPPKATGVPVKCDRCEQPATVECLECNIPLCQSCNQLLHAGKWSSHTISALDKKSGDSSSRYKVPSGIRNLNIGSLPDLVKAMTDKEVGIKLRDRKYFLKTYKNVFDGGECVDWILRNLPIRNRVEAVNLGAKLLESKYIEPIQSGSPFKDEDKSLYKFASTPLLVDSGDDQGAAQRVMMDDFELLQVLGSGGFGKVVQVRKKETGKIYAMKIIKKSKIKDSQKRINDILNEKTILQNDNLFLVHLHYSFQTTEALCFVVDFISGGDLWFHLKRVKNGFPKKIARFFAAEIVLAIEYLHSQGVVYRDLKPENVLVDADGHICLTDFGIATILEEDNRTSSIVGTTCFMAPEVLKGLPYGKAVDWWSLGVLLYHMLTGRHPFYSSNKLETIERIMTKKITPTPNCPSKTGFDLIEKLLERTPELRLCDFQRIRKHPFFRQIEWEKLAVKKVKPPFKISVGGPHDLSNFEDEMKRKPIFTEVEEEKAEEIDYFPDFTFVNRSVL